MDRMQQHPGFEPLYPTYNYNYRPRRSNRYVTIGSFISPTGLIFTRALSSDARLKTAEAIYHWSIAHQFFYNSANRSNVSGYLRTIIDAHMNLIQKQTAGAPRDA